MNNLLDNYYLDLEKVFALPEKQAEFIQNTYRDMVNYNSENICKYYFNTLNENGYLVNIRDKKIDDVLDEESK